MKIRQGFVSNSSSSSFYLRRPDRSLKFSEIPEYYSFNPDVPENARAWMQILVWEALKPERYQEEYSEYSGDCSPKEALEEYTTDSHISWMQSSDSLRKPESYWQGVKELRDNPDGLIGFGVDGYDNEVFDGVKIPYSAAANIREYDEDVFRNPRYAVGLSE